MIVRDIDCTVDTPVVFGKPKEPIYGLGKEILPRLAGKQETAYERKIYLEKLLPLEQYDLIVVLFSGGKDSTAAYYSLLELGVPKEKIELWHHCLDGGHPVRRMDWPVTQAYVQAFAQAEEVTLRVSRRVNGFFGEVYRIGAPYPIEYQNDKGEFVACPLSEVQEESDKLRKCVMEAAGIDVSGCHDSAELNRLWCSRSEELLLNDIVSCEMEKLDAIGNKRIFPQASGITQGRFCTPKLKIDVANRILRTISELKQIGYHLRLPAKQNCHRGRWCTSTGKAKVQDRITTAMEKTRQDINILVVSGERRGESKPRAKYNEVEIHSTNATAKGSRLVHQWRMVIDYSERDVWEVLRRHHCTPHPCYAAGWNRCSCMMCIFSKREQWAGIRELFPTEFAKLCADEKALGYTLHIGQALEDYVGDAQSCVYHSDAKALQQLIQGEFSVEDIFTEHWAFPAGAFHGAEGGPC